MNRVGDDGLAGVIFWLCFIGLAAFALGHGTWYDKWPLPEQINFWVAAGTLGLGVVSAWNVIVTRMVVGAEDRRHRQGLAPIIRIAVRRDTSDPSKMIGLQAKNVGLGPALHIEIVAMHGPGHAERLEDRISALGVGDERAVRVQSLAIERPPIHRAYFKQITVRYEDMFGNGYMTSYTDFGSLSFQFGAIAELR